MSIGLAARLRRARGPAALGLGAGVLALTAALLIAGTDHSGTFDGWMALAVLGYALFPLLALLAAGLLAIAALLILADRRERGRGAR